MRKIQFMYDDDYTGVSEVFHSKVDCCTDKSCPTVAQMVQCLMNGGSIGRPIVPADALSYDFNEKTNISDDILIETNDVSLSARKNVDFVDFDNAIDTMERRIEQMRKLKAQSKASRPIPSEKTDSTTVKEE